MANIPEKQQIVPEDFEEDYQDSASIIAQSFNTYVDQLNEILSSNLTFSDNIRGLVRTFVLKGDGTVTFKYDLTDKPTGIWPISYYNVDDIEETITAGVSVQWSYDGAGNITIKRVGGLDPAKTYSVTIIVIAG